MKKQALVFVLSFISLYSFGQKKIAYNNLVWVGDFTTAKLNERWSFYFDFGVRRTEWLEKWSQVLVRPGLTYHFNKSVSATGGVAYFSHYTSDYIRPEGRGWEQLLFSETYGRFKISHRVRAEQRFFQRVVDNKLMEDYNYNNRFRYQLGIQVALNKSAMGDKTLYLSMADEIFINSGKEIVGNYFDQNRASIGWGYKWNEKLTIQVSYMNDFIQKAKVDHFENDNVLVFNIFQNLDFRKKLNAEGK